MIMMSILSSPAVSSGDRVREAGLAVSFLIAT